MTKHDEWHLIAEQISAYIDKQLSPREQAACEAHLQTCVRCQQALAGWRQMVALLHALPQPALPHSFALPGGVSHLQRRPERRALSTSPRSPARQYSVGNSLRAVSTIVAVIGLLILLGGVLLALPHSGTVTTSSPATNTGASSAASTPERSNVFAPNRVEPASATAASKKATATIPAAPVGTPTAGAVAQPVLPLPAPRTPLGLQWLGFTLFALGAVGLLLTRRRQRDR